MDVVGRHWHAVLGKEPNRIQCDICPRNCEIKDGSYGFCFVRQNDGGKLVLTTYGRSSGFCVDPIEKKPLNHFFPGTSVLSFGTIGCNLGCQFCQNWDISKARESERLQRDAMPHTIAKAAASLGCRSVAFTYNDPIIFFEYAIDVAKACRELGVKTVAVSAGYFNSEPRKEFFRYIDAANIDLKAFTQGFYKKICRGDLAPVLDTLCYLKHETNVWFEITTLIVPGANDDMTEIRDMCRWIYRNLGQDVPLHFTAFHPDYKMKDLPPTSRETLHCARQIAFEEGLHYVYTGNVVDPEGDSTWCLSCGALVIEREWYELGKYAVVNDACQECGMRIPGVFGKHKGTWGRRRLNVSLSDFESAD